MPGRLQRQPAEVVQEILRLIEELNHLKDVDSILDRVLFEARRMTGADAGSIYLIEGERLRFSYVHNDVLYGEHDTAQMAYQDFCIPMDDSSIVGWVATTGKPLVIDDAYELDPELPFTFNSSFDEKTGYRTRSMFTLPLTTLKGRVVGVMQLLNATDPDGETRPFDAEDQHYAPLFANNASVAIERGIMTRELMLRMMKMAQMRDPAETGSHVQRVGAYAAEIYAQWARNRDVDRMERRRVKDLLRLAAMLHDVGKVGISDNILKKPGRLDQDEFATMQWHTVYGAALFANVTSDLDELCRDIALCHHQRYDGRGYPGHLPEDLGEVERLDTDAAAGEAIPLAARITALADVYDALCSKRTYKDPWPEERVLDLIRQERGGHFDPEVVDAFLGIHDTIIAIKQKYQGEWDVLNVEPGRCRST